MVSTRTDNANERNVANLDSFSSQGVTVVNKSILLLLVIVGVAACEVASAQVPTYAPYGAWRGRIRYVRGPFRTRSTIHWGNGVTPTGGQVLMFGMSTAENVLTNPDFLNATLGRRDAEADETHKNISETVDRIRAINADLRTSLSVTVLDKLDVKPSSLGLPGDTPAVDKPDPPQERSVAALYRRFTQNTRDLIDLGKKIKSTAPEAVGEGAYLQSKRAELRLTDQQDKSLTALTQFAQAVSETMQAAPSQRTQFERPDIALGQFQAKLHDLSEDCKKVEELAGHLLKDGIALRKYVNVPFVQKGIDDAKQISEKAAQWGAPPAVSKTLFASAGDPAASPEAGSSSEPLDGSATAVDVDDPFAADPPGATCEDADPDNDDSDPDNNDSDPGA